MNMITNRPNRLLLLPTTALAVAIGTVGCSGFVEQGSGASASRAPSQSSSSSVAPSPSVSKSPSAPTATSRAENLKILTWNVSGENRLDVGLELEDLVAERSPDLFGLQEMYSGVKRQQVKDSKLFSVHGYKSTITDYKTTGPGREQNPILYKEDRLKLIKLDKTIVSPNPSADGKKPLDDKEITRATFEDKRSKEEFTYINVHPVAYAEVDGEPASAENRVDYYDKYMTVVVEKVTASRQKFTDAPVFVGGDLNVGAVSDNKVRNPMFPTYRLGQLGLVNPLINVPKRTNTRKGGGGMVDRIFIPASDTIRLVSTDIISDTHGSDHNEVADEVTIG